MIRAKIYPILNATLQSYRLSVQASNNKRENKTAGPESIGERGQQKVVQND